jgi:hypothetical protein
LVKLQRTELVNWSATAFPFPPSTTSFKLANMTKRTKSESFTSVAFVRDCILTHAQRSVLLASTAHVTVRLYESKSRRWKSPSTPDTSAHSAARTRSRDTQLASGIAKVAERQLQVAHGQFRKFGIGKDINDVRRPNNSIRTPAAAATRSTIRRLREIAEV